MWGINVNGVYADLIVNGSKTIETRRKNTLRSVIGQRVGIIKTGCGRAQLIGYVTISGIKKYNDPAQFNADYNKHLVGTDSKYYCGGVKYGYVLTDAETCKPKDIYSKGIVKRGI